MAFKRFSPCLLLIAWLSTAGAQDKSGAPRKWESVTLGLSAKHVLNLPIYLAQRHGIFESEGFDYKPITTKTNTAIAALVSGDLDFITAFNSGLGAATGTLKFLRESSGAPPINNKWPEPVSRIRAAGFSNQTQNRILGENAARLYNLQAPLG